MRLDSITKIERYIANVLLSSPLVPLGVNVVRLADVSDEEGLLQMVNSMVVRYTGSNGNTVQRSPLTREETMTFEVNIASQSYLTQSGHDLAVQLCAAVRMTLMNTVPPNTGLEIVEPLSLVSEQFSGLTDSSHYTYTQQWQLTVQDLHRAIAIDPCVQRGDCSRLFPQNTKTQLGPGETVCGNIIYAPVLPPPSPSMDYSVEYSGAEFDEFGNLVYKWDPTQVFMTATELGDGWKRVCTGTQDESGRFEIINIHRPDGTFDRFFFAVDTGNRLLALTESSVRILGEGQYTAESFGNTEIGLISDMPVTGYGFVVPQQALIYLDPTDPDASTVRVTGNAVFAVASGTFLNVDGDEFVRVGGTPLGRAWIKSSNFQLFRPDQYLPRLDCDSEGLEGGKIDSCD